MAIMDGGISGIVNEDFLGLVSSPEVKTTINPIIKFFSKMNTYCIKTQKSEEIVRTKSCYIKYNGHSVAFSPNEGKSYRIIFSDNVKVYKVINEKRIQLN